jgi:hypothetical protein
LSGTAEGNLDRAKVEINRVLTFRGSVTKVKVEGKRIIVEFDMNPAWDLPESEKVKSVKEWILAKVRTVFKVISVSG